MPRLLVLQSVWGLDRCAGFDIWHGLEAALDRVSAAGFDGAGVNLVRIERTAITARVMAERGLAWEAQVVVRSGEELDRFAEQAARLGARHLNVQIAGPPERLAEALALVDELVPAAERAPLPVFFETHRGRLSQDMALFLRLLAARPALQLTGDLSHYVVAGEMDLPLSPAQLTGYDRILRNCEAFHGRVATAHQVQAPLGPHHRPWTELFLGWWRAGFDYWLARHGEADTLSFMVELGPPPYAVTDAQGRELTDRWQDALALKDMVRGLWDDALSERSFKSGCTPPPAIG